MLNKDIVIISVPGTISENPPAAPAALKSSVEAAGFTCKTLDFNIKLHQLPDYTDLETFFCMGLNKEVEQQANDLVKQWVTELLEYNPIYVGISVFTYQNRIATELFCKHLKEYPHIKIILGGQGLTDGGILGAQGFAKLLISKSLADHYIKSEGEYSLVELLKGNLDYPGIDSDNFKQIEDLDNIPIPNYDDYDFDLYKNRTLPITASRGCVRACNFCDIHDHWKYNYRTGGSVAQEMIELSEKYQINKFDFTDSLVNGSLLEFNKLCIILAEHNRNNKIIKWSGQYIVRAAKHLNEEYWINLSASGAQKLAVGVETGSDSVRLHMNKKFTNVDLDYTMEMLDKYDIGCIFLMIVGYPTETEQDFQNTLAMFKKYQHLANRIITDINIGSTLGILPGTPLYTNANEYHIEVDNYENNWIAHDNPTLTLEERLRRLRVMREYVIGLGYSTNSSSAGVIAMIEQQLPKFEKRNKIKNMIRLKEIK